MSALEAAADVLRTDAGVRALGGVVAAARAEPEDAQGVAALAQVLGRSGAMLRPRSGTIDVASTGGPGSLSTLLTSYVLLSRGAVVPKIAVPGRPAGGVDALGSLRGFDVYLGRERAEAALDECGHVHLCAGARWAPLDARLFEFRKSVGAQGLAPLAAASILGKKVAAQVGSVVLDVRVSSGGNLGSTEAEASAGARLFIEAARLLDIRAVAVLTDSTGPRQPGIGRGEALLALYDVFEGRATGALARHVEECVGLAAHGLGDPGLVAVRTEMKRAFVGHLVSQGCTQSTWLDRVDHVSSARRAVLTSSETGYLTVDTNLVRSILVEAQREQSDIASKFTDQVGILLSVMPGERVDSGQAVAGVRDDRGSPASLATRLARAFSITSEPPAISSWSGLVID